MDALDIEECVMSSRILVGVTLDAKECAELLSWAIGVAAHPNDTVVALHVLGWYIIFFCI